MKAMRTHEPDLIYDRYISNPTRVRFHPNLRTLTIVASAPLLAKAFITSLTWAAFVGVVMGALTWLAFRQVKRSNYKVSDGIFNANLQSAWNQLSPQQRKVLWPTYKGIFETFNLFENPGVVCDDAAMKHIYNVRAIALSMAESEKKLRAAVANSRLMQSQAELESVRVLLEIERECAQKYIFELPGENY